MPALMNNSDFSYAGVGSRSRKRAEAFAVEYPGKVFGSYEEVVESSAVDAIYIPLPPALHFTWAEKALITGKHVLLEKPFTESIEETRRLIAMADQRGLALHENYMFVFHRQIEAVRKMLDEGEIGDVRLYRMSFGFPMRSEEDFRYRKELGGGALFDAGGYCLRLAALLLGDSAHITTATANYTERFEVDLYGSATVVNSEGITVQLSFGMDNDYQCELDIWGSRGRLTTGRIFTAPACFSPVVKIGINGTWKEVVLPADDTFYKSICWFYSCIEDEAVRKEQYRRIEKQAEMMEEFRRVAGM